MPCAARPFGVDDREPGRIAAAALVDHGLAEQALGLKAQPQGRALRGLVEVVALPFMAAVAEFVEHELHQQVLGLGGHRRALEQRRKIDGAHFDGPVRGVDAHERQRADRAAAAPVDDGEMHRVGALRDARDVGTGAGGVGGPLDAEVGPVAAVRGLRVGGVQVFGVLDGIERFEGAEAALDALARRQGARAPVGQQGADGLAEFVVACWHADVFLENWSGKAESRKVPAPWLH
jgi:hypothetical protein